MTIAPSSKGKKRWKRKEGGQGKKRGKRKKQTEEDDQQPTDLTSPPTATTTSTRAKSITITRGEEKDDRDNIFLLALAEEGI